MAQDGDKVKVHYTGTLKDGTVFDSSVEREPLAFIVGAGQMIAGFDRAVVGMKVGESKTVTIPAAQAYGQRDESLIFKVECKNLPPDLNPKVGDELLMRGENRSSRRVKVVGLTDLWMTIDANHELAGQDLIFEIKMVEIAR